MFFTFKSPPDECLQKSQTENDRQDDNAIQLPTSPTIKWQDEGDLYTHLRANSAFRKQIFDLAAPQQMFANGCVWVHHTLLFYPLPIHAKNTEAQFLNELNFRLNHSDSTPRASL